MAHAAAILTATALVASALSALGSLFIICNWLLFAQMRVFFTKLIVYLSIANLLSSASYGLSLVDAGRRGDDAAAAAADDAAGDTLCRVQAALIVVFETSSVLWTVAIAWTLFEQVVRKSAQIERLEKYYHAVCWGAPVVAAGALLGTAQLGPADSRDEWCWIAGERPSTRWLQVGVFYVPLLAAFALSAVVYVRVGRAFGDLAVAGAVDAGKERMVQLRLRLYLLVFLVVWTFPLVHRTQQLFSPASPFWLQLLHAATGGRIMGLLNSLVYGCNDKTLRPYRSAATRLRRRLSASTEVAAASSRGAAPEDAAARGAAPREALLQAARSASPPPG